MFCQPTITFDDIIVKFYIVVPDFTFGGGFKDEFEKAIVLYLSKLLLKDAAFLGRLDLSTKMQGY